MTQHKTTQYKTAMRIKRRRERRIKRLITVFTYMVLLLIIYNLKNENADLKMVIENNAIAYVTICARYPC